MDGAHCKVLICSKVLHCFHVAVIATVGGETVKGTWVIPEPTYNCIGTMTTLCNSQIQDLLIIIIFRALLSPAFSLCPCFSFSLFWK